MKLKEGKTKKIVIYKLNQHNIMIFKKITIVKNDQNPLKWVLNDYLFYYDFNHKINCKINYR